MTTNERHLPDGRVELIDTKRVEASPLYNHDLVLDPGTGRPARAHGQIDDSHTAHPRTPPNHPVGPGPKVVLHNEAPATAILYRVGGKTRLITVHEGHAYYVSLGESVSTLDGVESTKVAGEFYEFAGIQETEPPPLPAGVEVPDYDKIGRGWLIKAKGFTPIDPVARLREFTYRLEPGRGIITRPEEVNDWLAAEGAVPVLDFFRQVLGWE